MANIVHVHTVLHLIIDKIEKKEYFSKHSLKELAVDVWGENVQFTSCSENIFGVDELVNFLLERQKVFIKNDLICINNGVEESECLNS